MPSAARTRTRRPEDRRDELLDAAAALFVESGVGATTVAEIAERAGVAKGTFYLYFDSKDQIVAGLHERLGAGMDAIAQEALADLDGVDMLELGQRIVAAIIDYWIAERELYVEIAQAASSPECAAVVAETHERVIQLFEFGVRAGIEAGQFSVDSPTHTAQFLFYGCEGVTTAALMADGPVDRDGLVSSSQAIIRRILAPQA